MTLNPRGEDADIRLVAARRSAAPIFMTTAAALPAIAVLVGGAHHVQIDPWIHFVGVGFAAAIATGAALALTVMGALQSDGRAVLAGLAFSLMAALLCLHGASTPGILVGSNGVIAFTGGATLPVGCAILALGTLSALRRPEAVRPLLVALALGVGAILSLGISMIHWPGLVPSVPAPRSPLALAVLAVGLAATALLVVRALRTYLLTRRFLDLVVVGIAWLGTALVASLVYSYENIGWWFGHALEIVAMALVGIPVALDLRRGAGRQSRPLVGDLRAVDLVTSEEAFLGSQVRALLVALALKDGSTEEHTRRVALLAVEVGDELGLPPGRLRSMATGGLLHDIGKLSVRDEVLRKPASLTDEEFSEVKQHAAAGVALLEELGGFDPLVVSLVNDHHERLDGSGYPRGLADGEISLEAQVLAVCDVYDALISPRVYRAAWPHYRALALLRQGAGLQFEPRCVDALERVLTREQASSVERQSESPAASERYAAASEAFLSAR
jgi:putative nucleotidyltransferase with HDIG domain